MRLLRALGLSLVSFVCLTPSFAAGNSSSSEPSKSKENFSFLVGINDYYIKPDGQNPKTLKGCLNDIDDMRKLLSSKFHFIDDSEHMRVLLDRGATRDEIIKQFKEQLTANSLKHPHGVFLFQFSLHGTSGKAPKESDPNASHYDEAIVTADAKLITFDEIAQLCRDVSKNLAEDGNFTVILDSCHSAPRLSLRGMVGESRFTPDSGIVKGNYLTKAPSRSSGTRGEKEATLGPLSSSVVISACLANETENETTGDKPNGVLTWNLKNILSEDNGGMSYQMLADRLSAASADWNEHPAVEGNLKEVVLRGGTSLVEPYFSVKANGSDGTVTIKAGKLQGLKTGGIVAFYDSSATSFDGKTKLLCQGTVKSAEPFSSTVTLNDAVSDDKIMGAKVVSVTPGFSTGPLQVAILKSKDFDGSVILDRMKGHDDSEVKVYGSEGQLKSAPWDVVVFQDFYKNSNKIHRFAADRDENTTAFKPDDKVVYLIGKSGLPLYGLCLDAAAPASSERIAKALLNFGQQQSLLSLTNPKSPLNDKIKFEVIRTNITPVIPEPPSQLKVGDKIRVKLTNISPDPYYVYLFVVGSAGSIQQVYPPPGSPDDQLEAGKSAVFPPNDATMAIKGPQGADTYKLFVTNKKQDLSNWNIGAVRGEAKGGLSALLSNSYNRTRELEAYTPDPPDEWGVKSFDVSIVGKPD